MLNMNSAVPIYIQIAQWLENEILVDHLKVDDKVHSQYQLAELFQVNPATAGKAITHLIEHQYVYKKRGLGTFVAEGAKELIQMKRKSTTMEQIISQLIEQAKLLGVTETEVIKELKRAFREEE